MRIGIDISQVVYEGSGVARYVYKLVEALIKLDPDNDYILFGSSLRLRSKLHAFYHQLSKDSARVRLVVLPLPPKLLDLLWNRMHIMPIEWFIGNVDIFWSSDWTQPPLKKSIGMTTIHDVSVLRYPENFDETIVNVQKRRLARAKKTCSIFLCDSEATKTDVMELLDISEEKLRVVYPGFL